MPFKRMKTQEIPTSKRRRKNLFKESEEYRKMTAALANGLKPSEAIEITLPPDLLKKRKNAARLFKLTAEAFINDAKLPYDVLLRGLQEAEPRIYIVGRADRIA